MWFRQDLRLRDNPALTFAAQHGVVLPIYILDRSCPERFQPGGASKWWLHHSLQSLQKSLNKQLHCLAGDAKSILLELVKSSGVKRVVWNRCYEPWQIKRDTELKQILFSIGVEVHSFNGQLLWEPWQVLKKDQTPYKVFTPYYRKGCLSKVPPRFPVPVPESLKIKYLPEADEGITSLDLLPDNSWYGKIESLWSPGEQGAARNLSTFLPEQLGQYKAQRDFPHEQATSRLSAHLHFGEISPNQIWYAAIDAKHGEIDEPGLDCYLSELGWREFSHYLLYHFPALPEKNFNPKFDKLVWREDKHSLKAWQKGQTGIPIIDAGMRELWQTGTMQNRVRMLVGSFLVKNLLLDWRLGERWFWDCLVDADLAANSASWQWVAGSGADAAPYFRIFNPVLQGQRFDSNGCYVRQYCPELAKLPDKFIHNPWDAPPQVLESADIQFGVSYPLPLVDLKASRLRALDAFSEAKKMSD
ncbi:MAG: deoxyribodipyrimidine photo-lyase [Paraglaciecola sp.]|jgi:deoxyribodipyrimidine photo-lyase